MSPPANRGRLQALAPIALFDVVGPLVVYYSLRSAGSPTVAALILSGLLPAVGLAIGLMLRRRVDAVGALVMTGIVVGSAAGLASGSTHAVLLDGVVPTAVFGLACLGSLWSRRPLIYRFALEAIGADTPRGCDFAERWRHGGFRHAFRVATVVWGGAFLGAAVAQVVIIETASAATARTTSGWIPLAVGVPVAVWNTAYAKRGRRLGELAAEAARVRAGATPPALPR